MSFAKLAEADLTETNLTETNLNDWNETVTVRSTQKTRLVALLLPGRSEY